MPFRMVTPASMRVLALLVLFVCINAMTPQEIEDRRIELAHAEDIAVARHIALRHNPIALPPVDPSNLITYGRALLNSDVWAYHARAGSTAHAATIVSFENFGTGDVPAIRVMFADGTGRQVRVNTHDVWTRTENDAEEMAALVPEVRQRMDEVDAFEDAIRDMEAAAAAPAPARVAPAPAPVAPAPVAPAGGAVAAAAQEQIYRLQATLATYRTNAQRFNERLNTMQEARNEAEDNVEDAYRALDEAEAAAARAQHAQQAAQDAESLAQQMQEEAQNELGAVQQQLRDLQDLTLCVATVTHSSVGTATVTHSSVGTGTDSDMTDDTEAGTPSRTSGRPRAQSERFTYGVLGAKRKDTDLGGRGGGGGSV